MKVKKYSFKIRSWKCNLKEKQTMKKLFLILALCLFLISCKKEYAQWEKDFIEKNYSPSIIEKIELKKEHIDNYLRDADRYGSSVINEAGYVIEQYQKKSKENTGIGLVTGTVIFKYKGETIRKGFECTDKGLKTN